MQITAFRQHTRRLVLQHARAAFRHAPSLAPVIEDACRRALPDLLPERALLAHDAERRGWAWHARGRGRARLQLLLRVVMVLQVQDGQRHGSRRLYDRLAVLLLLLEDAGVSERGVDLREPVYAPVAPVHLLQVLRRLHERRSTRHKFPFSDNEVNSKKQAKNSTTGSAPHPRARWAPPCVTTRAASETANLCHAPSPLLLSRSGYAAPRGVSWCGFVTSTSPSFGDRKMQFSASATRVGGGFPC
jgi:hypothetical protein